MAGFGGFALALGSVALVDQAVKAVVIARMPRGMAHEGAAVVRVVPAASPGTFASRLGVPNAALAVLWVVALAAALVAIHVFGGALVPLALGAALGGAAGNLIDQMARGGVIDYVDLRVWPAFNLADVAIVAGVVTVIAALIVRMG